MTKQPALYLVESSFLNRYLTASEEAFIRENFSQSSLDNTFFVTLEDLRKAEDRLQKDSVKAKDQGIKEVIGILRKRLRGKASIDIGLWRD